MQEPLMRAPKMVTSRLSVCNSKRVCGEGVANIRCGSQWVIIGTMTLGGRGSASKMRREQTEVSLQGGGRHITNS